MKRSKFSESRKECQKPLFARTHSRQFKQWFLTPFYFASPSREQPDCPSLRASNEHSSYRARSASKKDGLAVPLLFF